MDLGAWESLWCLETEGGGTVKLLHVPDGDQQYMLVGHPGIRSEAECSVRGTLWFVHK